MNTWLSKDWAVGSQCRVVACLRLSRLKLARAAKAWAVAMQQGASPLTGPEACLLVCPLLLPLGAALPWPASCMETLNPLCKVGQFWHGA